MHGFCSFQALFVNKLEIIVLLRKIRKNFLHNAQKLRISSTSIDFSDFRRFTFLHFFPISIKADDCRFWTYINGYRCLTIKNPTIRAPYRQMHNIGSRLREGVFCQRSRTNGFIYSINIPIIPKIISSRNCFI